MLAGGFTETQKSTGSRNPRLPAASHCSCCVALATVRLIHGAWSRANSHEGGGPVAARSLSLAVMLAMT